jgi:hypothetical protein
MGVRVVALLFAQLVLAQATAQVAAAPATAVDAALNHHPPASVWMEQEQNRFGDWLAKRPADVLIAPFQVSGYGLDPAERLGAIYSRIESSRYRRNTSTRTFSSDSFN